MIHQPVVVLVLTVLVLAAIAYTIDPLYAAIVLALPLVSVGIWLSGSLFWKVIRR